MYHFVRCRGGEAHRPSGCDLSSSASCPLCEPTTKEFILDKKNLRPSMSYYAPQRLRAPITTLEVSTLLPPRCPACGDLDNDVERHVGEPTPDKPHLWCHDLNENYRNFNHQLSIQAFVDRAAAGCQGCSIIAWILNDYFARHAPSCFEAHNIHVALDIEKQEVFSIKLRYYGDRSHHCEHGTLLPFADVGYSHVKDGDSDLLSRAWAHLDLFKTEVNPVEDRWEVLPSRGLISAGGCSSTGDAPFLDRIKGWLDDCISCHSHSQVLQDTQLPTRVIDISALRTGGEPFLRVTGGATGRYVCLSHCWGKCQPLQTTRGTLSSHLQEIMLAHMPKTFADMLKVAQFLNVDYLWIDSLCIIQDDVVDWTKEAGLMATVYANAFLTLAATASDNCHGGLFKDLPTKASPFHERQVPVHIAGDSGPKLWYRHHLSHGSLYESEDNRRTFQKSHGMGFPLLSRAWVLQESLLSPRIVHFTGWEVVWSCCNGIRCCCDNDWMHEHASSNLHESFEVLINPAESLGHPRGDEMFHYWRRLINVYSRKLLTKPSDRLTALSGVVRTVQDAFGEENIAGIWQNNLTDYLLWNVERHDVRQEVQQKHGYIAPSWSWASVNCEVNMWGHRIFNHDDTMRILRAHCTVNELDRTGAVKDGYLRVFGAVAPCNTSSSGVNHILHFIGVPVSMKFRFDDTAYRPSATDTFYCLAMGRNVDCTEESYMILEQVQDDKYRRVGYQLLPVEPGKARWPDVIAASTLREITII